MKLKGKLAIGLATGSLALSLLAPSAFAQSYGETKATQLINGGSRDVIITPSTDFNPVTLDGEIQKTQADPGVLEFVDASGTGDGYRVTVEAEQFKTKAPSGGFAANTVERSLPLGSLMLRNQGAVVSTVGGSTSTLPTWNGNNWVIDSGSSVVIMRATKDTGMGKYNVDFAPTNLELTLNPATTYIDDVNYEGVATPYETTITYTIVSGP